MSQKHKSKRRVCHACGFEDTATAAEIKLHYLSHHGYVRCLALGRINEIRRAAAEQPITQED